jgi:hypothetical protein
MDFAAEFALAPQVWWLAEYLPARCFPQQRELAQAPAIGPAAVFEEAVRANCSEQAE